VTDDPSDVVEALEIARKLWDRGARKDAVRWVRRAAEAADEGGNIARVATLAHAAAELEEVASRPSSPKSQTRPASQPAPRSMNPPPLPSSRAPRPTSIPPASRTPSGVTTVSEPKANEQVAREVNIPGTMRRMVEQRIRVSVRTSARDTTLLVVRPLPEGQSAPSGSREAYLVMAEVNEDAKGNVA
jgi:hypothetical protein